MTTTPDMLHPANDTAEAFSAALRDEFRDEIRARRMSSSHQVQIAFAIMALTGVAAGLGMHALWRTLDLAGAAGDEIVWGFAIMSLAYMAALWGWELWDKVRTRRALAGL